MLLDEVAKRLPENVHAAMIADGAAWHRSKALKIPENISMIDIPPYAPDCNPAEKPWQFIKPNFLANRVFDAYEDILDACCQAWNAMTGELGRIASLTSMQHLLCQKN